VLKKAELGVVLVVAECEMLTPSTDLDATSLIDPVEPVDAKLSK
jgi:hypothetical protein